MTLEEARQLKPGDRVLVEATVGSYDTTIIDEQNYVWIFEHFINIENIREKVAPQRRKFRKGDIVMSRNGYIYFAVDDEDENGEVGVDHSEDSDAEYFEEGENLTLLLAVEDRSDRKEEEV